MHWCRVLAHFKNSAVIYALQINALLKTSFLSDELKLASLDYAFCCRLLTSAQPSQKSVLSMRSLLKLGDLKVLQLSEQAEVPNFEILPLATRQIFPSARVIVNVCVLSPDMWPDSGTYIREKKKARIQQLVWELKLYSIPRWPKKFRDKQENRACLLGRYLELVGPGSVN